jgi:hypothetical protein
MDLIDANKKRLRENLHQYRKRQAIVEHPFGTIKRQWDFYYIMTKKTLKHATADVGLIFTAYNLRRLFNLIDPKLLKTYLEGLAALFLGFWGPIIVQLSPFKPLKIFQSKNRLAFSQSLNGLKSFQNERHAGGFWVFLGF